MYFYWYWTVRILLEIDWFIGEQMALCLHYFSTPCFSLTTTWIPSLTRPNWSDTNRNQTYIVFNALTYARTDKQTDFTMWFEVRFYVGLIRWTIIQVRFVYVTGEKISSSNFSMQMFSNLLQYYLIIHIGWKKKNEAPHYTEKNDNSGRI